VASPFNAWLVQLGSLPSEEKNNIPEGIPMSIMSRRTFAAGAIAGSTLAGSSFTTAGSVLAQTAPRLRCFWWGNPDRDKRTKAALDAYKAKSGTDISAEALGWGDYWTKLGTQTAGGNAPDLIQMDYRYIFEYARRGTLLALEGQMPKPLDLGTFSDAARDSGKVDGKLYGVALGTNSKAMVYDTAMFEKVGVKALDQSWTWDEFARIAGEISKLNPGKYWGSGDNSRWEQGFEHWLNQRGKLLYSAEGKAGFKLDDITAWFDLWDKLRKSGAVAPAEVGATNTGSIDQYEISRGTAAMSFANSNQVVAFQAINKSKLALSVFPNEKGAASGHYIKPSMLMSVSAKSKAPDEAAKVIQYMVNDPEGVKILGIERGVPPSSTAQQQVAPELDDLGKMQVNFVAAVTKVAVPLPPPPPKGAGEIEKLMLRVADSVAFGRASVKDGAQQFFTEAESILARA
jgi:multiple sugar transport system substrate-binding protein